MISEKISVLGNMTKSFFNHREDIVYKFFNDAKKIHAESKIQVNPKVIAKYNKLVAWDKKEIHPCLPYALMTKIQISIVANKKFPFSPFGLIHKYEKIEVLKELKIGNWIMRSRIPIIRKVNNGYEIDIISDLFINGELCWRSTTTAFKRTKNGLNKEAINREEIKSFSQVYLDKNLGRKYALFSNNFDLIHISDLTAKMLGHKKAIIHGMWTVARSLSEMQLNNYPLTMNFKFISPIHMDSKIKISHNATSLKVVNQKGNRIHLLGQID